MVDVLLNCLIQILSTLGMILISGQIIAFFNKLFYKIVGSKGRVICYVTGFIGTPLHELGHVLMCVIFGHKIHKINFYSPNSPDGTLGYVSHSYNKNNLWQKAGNFFIGVGPIIIGYLALFGLLYLLLPELLLSAVDRLQYIDFADNSIQSLKVFFEIFVELFKGAVFWQWWVFIFLGSFIALHMTLSKPDLEGAMSGLILCLLAFLAVNTISALISMAIVKEITCIMLILFNFMLFFFCIFLMIIVVMCALAKVIVRR